MEKLGDKLDKLWVGLLCGLIGPWLGMVIFYLILFNHKSFYTFTRMMMNNTESQSALVSVSLVFNLVFFLLAMKYEWYKAGRGIIMSVFIYAPLVIYLKYG